MVQPLKAMPYIGPALQKGRKKKQTKKNSLNSNKTNKISKHYVTDLTARVTKMKLNDLKANATELDGTSKDKESQVEPA